MQLVVIIIGGGLIMDAFEFALQMELDGEKYYRDLAKKTKYDDLKTVLEGLAEDEKNHYQIIQLAQKQMIQNSEVNSSLGKVDNVFTATKNKALSLNKSELIAKLKDEQFDLYRAALVKEEESVALYKDLTEKSKITEEKIIFAKLAHEEEKHVEVINNIIDMLNNVNDWVEAAEFNHKDTY